MRQLGQPSGQGWKDNDHGDQQQHATDERHRRQINVFHRRFRGRDTLHDKQQQAKWRCGVANLQSYAKLRNPEVDALEEQIRVLKNIVAKQQIELEFKTELLKKSQSLEQRRLK